MLIVLAVIGIFGLLGLGAFLVVNGFFIVSEYAGWKAFVLATIISLIGWGTIFGAFWLLGRV